MRHPKQSPKLEREKAYWAIEVKQNRFDEWETYPVNPNGQRENDGLTWTATTRKRARQRARDLRRVSRFHAIRAIKLQRITRA
ncbi:MAG: hypothetical protein IT366_24440 [Candidatus Hydrogenedentes bacterium]|nr:hypothetical protein [Candidatus Hydrogenedentota bacterium]